MIHMFFSDQIFINRLVGVVDNLSIGSVGTLSPLGLSYFVQPATLQDRRIVRRGNGATFGTVPGLVFDKSMFASFANDLSQYWTDDEKAQLFNIVESLCLTTPYANDATLVEFPIYLQGSVSNSGEYASATAYISQAEQPVITTPTYITFSVAISTGTEYQFQIWLDNATFITEYPLSTITAVVPPLPISDLFNMNIVDATDNIFNVAHKSSTISVDVLDDVINIAEYSGFIAHDVRFVDSSGNYVTVQFNILFKGKTPGVLAVRNAIRALLLTSGIGTQQAWAARCPELFISATFYIIPMWDNTVMLADQQIWPSMIKYAEVLSNARAVLYDETGSFVNNNLCVFASSYNTMIVTGVPGDTNPTDRLLLSEEHPTFQYLSSTEAGFAFMAPLTREFAIMLAKALSAAAGHAIDVALAQTVLNERHFISFTVGDVEYLVITKDSYLTLLGV